MKDFCSRLILLIHVSLVLRCASSLIVHLQFNQRKRGFRASLWGGFVNHPFLLCHLVGRDMTPLHQHPSSRAVSCLWAPYCKESSVTGSQQPCGCTKHVNDVSGQFAGLTSFQPASWAPAVNEVKTSWAIITFGHLAWTGGFLKMYLASRGFYSGGFYHSSSSMWIFTWYNCGGRKSWYFHKEGGCQWSVISLVRTSQPSIELRKFTPYRLLPDLLLAYVHSCSLCKHL